MGHQNLSKKSKFLALVLRHNPSAAGIILDENGWANVDDLMVGANNKNVFIDNDVLDEIVRTDNKQRYSYNEDKTKIRANQGHSINVNVELEQKIPPIVLYHGTANRFVNSIMQNGLKPQNRQYVHLSIDMETAEKVGSRHGKPAILQMDTKIMSDAGVSFYLSKNKVWLTKCVDPKYLTRIQ